MVFKSDNVVFVHWRIFSLEFWGVGYCIIQIFLFLAPSKLFSVLRVVLGLEDYIYNEEKKDKYSFLKKNLGVIYFKVLDGERKTPFYCVWFSYLSFPFLFKGLRNPPKWCGS